MDITNLDEKISKLQKSTRTTFKAMVPLHDILRMKFCWYYNWHLLKYASAIHALFLILFFFSSLALSMHLIISTSKITKAVGNNCASQAAGYWSNAATWTSCGGGIPGSGDDVTILHAVTLTAETDIGSGDLTISSSGTLTTGDLGIGYNLFITDLTIAEGGSLLGYSMETISIAGDLDNSGSISTSADVYSIQFIANTPGHTIITTEINNMSGDIQFTGGGEWTLLSNLTTNSSISISAGNLITQGYNFTAGSLSLTGGDFTGGDGATLTVDGLSITDSQSDFIAPMYITGVIGPAIMSYTHTIGTADWLTNSSNLPVFWGLSLPADTYYNVESLSIGPVLTGDTTIMGNLYVHDGSLEFPTFNIGEHTLDVRGYVEATGAGTSIVMTTGTLKVGGSFTVGDGILQAGTGTVQFTGTNETTVSGNNTFNNFTVDTSTESAGKTVTFTSGTTQTIGGTLTLNGASGKVLTIASSTPGTLANLSIPANIFVGDYINVSDSNVTGGTITPGVNSTDGGGNSGWVFASPPDPTPDPDPTPTPTPSATDTTTPSTSPAPVSDPTPDPDPTPTPTPSATDTTTPSTSPAPVSDLTPSQPSESTPDSAPSTSLPLTLFVHDSSFGDSHPLTDNSVPLIYSQRPTFSGTTYPNSIVEITINSNPIRVSTKSDEKGYWSYTLEQDLPYGEHTILIAVTTQEGKVIASNPQTFIVSGAPKNNESENKDEIPSKSSFADFIKHMVYIILAVILIFSLYFLIPLAKKRRKKDEKKA